MLMKKQSFVVLCSLFVMWGSNQIWAGDQSMDPLPSFFQKSLHATGEGMRYWYEEQGGFMAITNIPYAQLSCKHCHVESCDQCHATTNEDGKLTFSVAKARKMETCLVCHAREKLSIKFAKEAGYTDVHLAARMSCADCHKGHDVHFTNFLKTKEKKGNFVPTNDWLMLVNYQGKVTSATAMTLVYNLQTFVTYAPYFTHDVMKKGRPCEECHNNEAAKLLKKGKSVPVAKFVGDKIKFWKGVVPIIEDRIDWQFLDKQEGKWAPFASSPSDSVRPDVIQYSLYAKPLTEKQLKKLQAEQRSRRNK